MMNILHLFPFFDPVNIHPFLNFLHAHEESGYFLGGRSRADGPKFMEEVSARRGTPMSYFPTDRGLSK
jgi:hypothetical protein